MSTAFQKFEAIEKHAGLLGILIAVMISFGGLAEVAPLFVAAHSVKPASGVKPYSPLRLVGRDVYVREGCYLCHTQMIRSLRFETERYGHYSTAEESVYDRPFQWGSKRTGPDLARIGTKYSDDWQRAHLLNPRQLVPSSNMPAYSWLAATSISPDDVTARITALRQLGDPYTDEDIKAIPLSVARATELDALIAYLQGLGIDNSPPVAEIARNAGALP